MKQNKFSISKRLESFKFAFNGMQVLFREEHNARIHLFASIIAIGAGFFFNIASYEWVCIAFAIGLVLSLEIINSSIENLADFVWQDQHEQIKKVKDLGAAAVLIGALTALIVGIIIFVPKIIVIV